MAGTGKGAVCQSFVSLSEKNDVAININWISPFSKFSGIDVATSLVGSTEIIPFRFVNAEYSLKELALLRRIERADGPESKNCLCLDGPIVDHVIGMDESQSMSWLPGTEMNFELLNASSSFSGFIKIRSNSM